MTTVFRSVLLSCFVLAGAPFGTAQGAQSQDAQSQEAQNQDAQSQEAQSQDPQAALEAQRAELEARENVLAEVDAELEPQRAEVRRRREVLDQQLAALDSQEKALLMQEAALAAQEDVSGAQREALQLQRQAFEAQRAALQGQVEEVEALEAALAEQEAALAEQAAQVEALRQEVTQAEQAAARRREVAAQAQRQLLESLLVTLEDNPRYVAAQAAVDAAEAQLRAAYNPASLEVQGTYNTTDTDPSAAPQPEPQQQPEQPEEGGGGGAPVSPNSSQFSANATFRPFPFGDTRDLVRQQELALEDALLDFRETVTSLQGQALESALQLRLALQSVELANNTLEAARSGLEATRTRFERGAANERELRDAEANFRQAQNFVQNAQANLELARLSLSTLDLGPFGNAIENASPEEVDMLLELPQVAEGLPLAVRRSQVSLGQAAIGVGGAQRDLYPTAQASYNYFLDDRSSVSASLESRTLQPSVGYSYQDPARSGPESVVNGSLTLSVSASLSFGLFNEIDAVRDQRRAAQAGVEASEENAELQLVTFTNVLNEAERTLELERIQFRNARRDFEENQQRQDLGLINPLETQQALVDLLEADTELRQARLSALQARLDLYEFYALPPSEVLL